MKKNLLLLLVLSLLCVYAFLEFQKPEFSQAVPPTKVDHSKFFDFSKEICLFMGISLFTILVLSPAEKKNEETRLSWRGWLGGIVSILGTVTVLVLIFNPIGTFTWNINHVTQRDSRLEKIYLYNQLKAVPDMIFLGTSISRRIPAQEYADKFSLTGFNFAVKGGTIVDYITLFNLILSESTLEDKPTVIITEVLSPGLVPTHRGIAYYTQYPVEYLKYMPVEFAYETASTHFDRAFSFSSFSDMLFADYFIWNKQWDEISTLSADGTGTPSLPLKNKTVYKKAVAQFGGTLDKLLQCNELEPQGIESISRMATLSKERHISIVFYRSPINDDFYTIMKKKPRRYKPCEEKFNQFMKQIQSENPNVFYVDLSHYPSISSGGQALYMDSHHLNFVGSERVFEALTPTIQDAIEYARTR